VVGEELDLSDSTADLLLAYGAMDAWLSGQPIPPEVEAGIRERGQPWIEDLEAMPELRGAMTRGKPPRVAAEVSLLNSRRRWRAADDVITRSLIRLLRSSRREVFIQSPYVVLPQAGADLLAETARRGVRITILTNSPWSTDNPLTQGIFLEQWPKLLARVPGLRIFVTGDHRNLHGKLAVFDRELALIGTYNLDPASMAYNSELVAAAWSSTFAEEILRPREERLVAGAPQVFEYRIAGDAARHPRRGQKRPVVVEFGPDDHLRPEQMKAARRYRTLFRWMLKVKRKAPFL
jgi:phosphatidylserine/phosphatidylglycerophosphate/cardiolipin synthase-like enzyme